MVRGENYKGKLLFAMKDIVSFRTDSQPMYFMSTIFLKGKIDGFHITKFQLDYICNTTHPPHKILVKLCCQLHYM